MDEKELDKLIKTGMEILLKKEEERIFKKCADDVFDCIMYGYFIDENGEIVINRK